MPTPQPTCWPGSTACFPSMRFVHIAIIDRNVPSYFRTLRTPRALLCPTGLRTLTDSASSAIDVGRIIRVRYSLPRHKRGEWVGPGRARTASWTSRLSSSLDKLADLIPPPRKHRHRNTKVFAPNHPLRQGRDGARHRQCRGSQTPNQGCCHAVNAHATHANGHCDTAGPRSHDTSRIAWAKLPCPNRREVFVRVPMLRRRHPAHRLQTFSRV